MTTRPLSIPEIQRISIWFLIAWIAICAALFFFYLNFSWFISITDSLISNVLLAAACISVSNILGYYQPKNNRVFYVLILAVMLTVVIVYSTKLILGIIFSAEVTYLSFVDLSLPVRFITSFLCVAWCALANILWYRLEEQTETHERLASAKNLAKEAELNKLRHQLQPHFLFNSLNSVFALTMINPKEAGNMITKLASFLRGTLKRDDEIWVNVAEEMEYIQLYLDIEKVRFSHRLNIDVEVADNTLDLCLPGTLLQPIVENAIKFGLYNTSKSVTIGVHVKLENNTLIIQVKNPFDPEMKAAGGTGFGLSSIRRRLYLLFADNSLLQTETVNNNLYITTLKIPQRNDKSHTN